MLPVARLSDAELPECLFFFAQLATEGMREWSNLVLAVLHHDCARRLEPQRAVRLGKFYLTNANI